MSEKYYGIPGDKDDCIDTMSDTIKRQKEEIFRLKDAAAELFSFIEEHADKRFLHHATALAEFRKRLLG